MGDATTEKSVGRALGRRIAEARRKAGLTQAQLAERLGWSRDALINYEHGRRTLAVERLIAIAAALDLPPATLLIADASQAVLVRRLLTEPELQAQVVFFLSTLDDDDEH
jgi:transcriptional regulator with XRE-family HTH domain